MTSNEDRRVRKTKKSMSEALAKLLLEKPLKNITVREIADLADINRGTFYLHYKDVYDMAEQLQNEIFEKFNEIVSAHEAQSGTEVLFPMLVEMFHLLAENADLAHCLIGKNGDAAFIDKLKNVLKDKCFTNMQKMLNIQSNSEFDYFYHYVVSGCIGICGAWLAGGRQETPKQLAALTEKLILNGVDALK